jgi:hypothetical protein
VASTATDAVVQQVIVVIDSLGTTISTSLVAERTTSTPVLSTITEIENVAVSTAGPTTTAPLSNGGVLSTSSVVVVIDGQGNTIVNADGQTMVRTRRTETRQVVVTVYPTSTGTPGSGPQLVTGNSANGGLSTLSYTLLGLLGLFQAAFIVA